MVRKEETLWEERVIEEVLSGFVLSGREFFFSDFIVKLEFLFSSFIVKLDFFFFNLINSNVENCGSFKSFGFIYIYIYKLLRLLLLLFSLKKKKKKKERKKRNKLAYISWA